MLLLSRRGTSCAPRKQRLPLPWSRIPFYLVGIRGLSLLFRIFRDYREKDGKAFLAKRLLPKDWESEG
jgi:hypothetical protein